MHDSFTPLGGFVPLFNIQLGEIIFGGVGAGLYGMLVFVVLAVFIAGLMVGRTPEYLGKKIQSFEVKMAMLALLVLAGMTAPTRGGHREDREVTAVLAISHRDLLKFLRDPARMVSTFVFPLIFIGALGGSLQATFGRSSDVNLLEFTFTGVFAQTLFQSAASGVVSLIDDRANTAQREAPKVAF